MRIMRVVTGAALAAMLVAGAAPSPAAAQFGGLKKKLKAKLAEAVAEQVLESANPVADTTAAVPPASGASTATVASGGSRVAKKPGSPAPARPGPAFSDYVLELTPELLDRLDKGLAAEQALQREIDAMIGRQLPREQYDKCYRTAIASPEGQKIFQGYSVATNGDISQEQLRKASMELSEKFEQLSKPKCGLDPNKAQEVRREHADELNNAAPQGAGLTPLQFSVVKERILPLCAAMDALTRVAGEARVATAQAAIYWVYSEAEVAALQPRCARLVPALNAGV
ncbi:MAG: hypothetical protein FIB01_08775 [Gemmatimonadetes bacterium]|nr:hypothetical protein [Gemmatimonadota bacterium]